MPVLGNTEGVMDNALDACKDVSLIPHMWTENDSLLGKAILFDNTNWSDFIAEYRHGEEYPVLHVDAGGGCTLCVPGYTLVSDDGKHRPAIYIRPTQALLHALPHHILPITGDRLYFSLIRRSDDSVLFLISYSVIIGSRWLGHIDPATIPKDVFG